jgi:hypothetical protein
MVFGNFVPAEPWPKQRPNAPTPQIGPVTIFCYSSWTHGREAKLTMLYGCFWPKVRCLKICAALHTLEDGLNALKATGLF